MVFPQCFLKFFIVLYAFVCVICEVDAQNSSDQPMADSIIREKISLGMENITACIDEKVVLTCSDEYKAEDILSYKWVNKSTGDSIGNTRTITVRPDSTTIYELTIRYTLRHGERIVNGDFERGENDCYKVANWGGIGDCKEKWACRSFESDYAYVICNGPTVLHPEGACKISDDTRKTHMYFAQIKDHSGKGFMLVANGSPDPKRNKVVWKTTIDGIIPGKQYAFSAWVADIGGANAPMLDFSINGKTLGGQFEYYRPKNPPKWEQFYKIWTADATSAIISIVNKVNAVSGNDFSLDDISFAPVVEGIGSVEVKVLPRVDVEALANVEVCEGEDLELEAKLLGGSSVMEYQWWRKSDEKRVSEEARMVISDADIVRDHGPYVCIVGGVCGRDTVDFSIAVREKLSVGEKKMDTVTVCVGDRVELSASECSGYELTYQWKKPLKAGNWLPALGRDVAFVKGKAERKDEGIYMCAVAGQCGKDTLYWDLEVNGALRIEKQSNDTLVCSGSRVDLWVKASEDGGVIRWWGSDGVKREVDTLSVVAGEGAAIYEFEVDNGCAPSATGRVKVDVFPALGGVVISDDTVVCSGGEAVFRGGAKHGVKYVWNGPGGFHAEGKEVVVSDVTEAKEGYYYLTVSDTCGNVQRDSVKLTIYRDLEGLTINRDSIYCQGAEGETLQVKGGGEGLKYSWTCPNGDVVLKSKVVLGKVGYDNVGTYVCKVEGKCGTVSFETEVDLYAKLELEGNAGLVRVCEEEDVRLWANSNLPVVRYEWRKDGVLLEAETGSELLLEAVGETEVGEYECTVVTVCGTEQLEYRVELKGSTKITDHTLDLYVNENSPVHLFVNAKGENIRYKWTENDNILYSEQENKLFFGDIGTVGVREFVCEVMGECGVDSRKIKVTVGKYRPLDRDDTVRLCEEKLYMYNADLVPTGCLGGEALTYRWEHKGQVKSNVSILELERLEASDAGRYTCYISGACGNATLNLDVVVVKVPELTAFPDTIRVCEEDELEYIAHTVGNDSYTFSWQKNNAVLGVTDPLLHLKSVAVTDRGVYSCRVTGQCGEDKEEFDLLVLRKLKVLEAPDSLLECHGTPVRMEVVAVGDRVEYVWDGPHKSGWQTVFGAVYENPSVARGVDDGVYRCFMNSTCGRDTVSVVLDIEKELVLLKELADTTVCPGGSVALFARVNLGSAKYLWTFPDGRTSTKKELFIENISPVDTGVYRYQIVTKCGRIEGSIHLHLHQPMGELVVSRDAMVCEHESVGLSAFCEGKNVTYQWRGPRRFSSQEASFVIDDVTMVSTGEYNVVAKDVCGRQQTGRVSVALLNDLNGLTIAGDTILCAGVDFVVKAEVEGSASEYRWTHGGEVVGEESVFQLPMVSRTDTGVYVCRATGSCLSKEDSVRLIVYDLLKVEEGIDTVEVCAGVDTAFHVSASGEKVVYVWSRKGEEVGTRDSCLRFYGVSAVDTGVYVCRISSLCGEEVVRDFYLRMKPRTVIKSHTPDRFISENDSVLFFVRAEGENNVYTWLCDGVVVDNEGNNLKIQDAGKADTLNYTCVVAGDCGVDTVNMLLKIGVFKSLKETLSPDTLCEGSSYTYVADVIPENCYGDEPFVYTWYHLGELIHEGQLLKLVDLTREDGGTYTCIIKSECGVDTVEWQIYIMELPEIRYITPDTSVVEGSSHRITVLADGELLSYSFFKDGDFYSDRQSELFFDPVSIEHQGIYRVTVGNECSSVTGESALEVWQKTMIVEPLPEEAEICEGEGAVFHVKALGSRGLLYKWYHNGVLLSYPMIAELRLEKVALEDAGVYMCVASGHGGNDTCYMTLVINSLPEVRILGLTEICVNDLVHGYSSDGETGGMFYEWKVVGGELVGNSHAKEVDVAWDGTGEAKILLEVVAVRTGCRSKEERKIDYKQLPEVYLDIPELVGYCLDSLILNQGYPYGGDYRVNNLSATSVVFNHKELAYEVVYSYKDEYTECRSSDRQTIVIDKEPVLVLQDERVETGVCLPVALVVAEASEGELIWSGEGMLDVGNVLRPVYHPKADDGEDVYFAVELTDKYGCKANDYEVVSIVPEPLVDAMRDSTVGVCGEMELTVEYYTSRFDRLEWLPADLLESSGGSSAMVKEKVEGEHVFWVEVADVYGCKGVDTVVLTVLPPPPVEEKEFCEDVPLTVDCHDFFGYTWNDGYLDVVRTLDKRGDYLLTVTDRFGCMGSYSYRVRPMPALSLRDSLLFEGQTLEFVVKPDEAFGPYDIVWQDNSVSDSYLVEEEGLYSVTVSDYLGCTSRDSAYVEIRKRAIAAPDAFLPGSKGENGRFYLKEVNFASNFEMYIYDRWGRLLFKTAEIGFNGGWDGTFKGIDCSSGAYVWVALVDGKEVARGSLLLVK